jgi:hypothetical protein
MTDIMPAVTPRGADGPLDQLLDAAVEHDARRAVTALGGAFMVPMSVVDHLTVQLHA